MNKHIFPTYQSEITLFQNLYQKNFLFLFDHFVNALVLKCYFSNGEWCVEINTSAFGTPKVPNNTIYCEMNFHQVGTESINHQGIFFTLK